MATEAKKQTPKEAEKQTPKVDYWEERVPVFLHKPDGESLNARTVTHNGKNYQIQYNKEVMVPRKIAVILEESARNKAFADDERRRLEGTDHSLGEV